MTRDMFRCTFLTVLLAVLNACSLPVADLQSGLTDSASQTPQPGSPSLPTGPSQSALKCTDPSKTSPTGSYILSKVQYQNTLEDLFGTSIVAAAATEMSTVFDDIYDPDTYAKKNTISTAQEDAYWNTATAIATAVTANSTEVARIFGACANNASPAAACIDGYLSGFATKILRRPLTTAEKAFVKNSLMATAGTYKENLKAVLIYHLMSPYFLWRIELNGAATASSTRINLSPYELATRISYTITDSAPDATLMAAATAGSIMNATGLKSEVRRLMLTPRGKTKIINTILKWAQADKASDVQMLPAQITNGIQMSGIENAMLAEARSFVDYIVYTRNGSFKDLMTSDLSFATHAGVAAIYGHAPIASVTAPVSMTQRRQGLLMRAPAWTWATPKTNIIQRGVIFQKRILCNVIPSPSVDIADARTNHDLTEDQKLTVTNRVAVEYQTSPSLCMGCHALINPTGAALESFDPIGRIRTVEKIFDRRLNYQFIRQLPMSTAAVVPTGGSSPANVADAYDLITQLATSEEAQTCFSRNLFRISYERKDIAVDECQIKDANNIVTSPTGSLLDAIEAMIVNQHTFTKEVL